MKIIVTGFPPFLKVRRNPSEILVRRLAAENWTPRPDCSVLYDILPIDYEQARARIASFFEETVPPDVIVHTGLAVKSSAIHLERRAKNLVFPKDPQSHARYAEDKKESCGDVVKEGEAFMHATLPLEKIANAFLDNEIPHAFSDDAGSYLCNFAFYTTAHEIRRRGLQTLSGFIHLPFTTAEADILHDCDAELTAEYLPSTQTLERGLKLILHICAEAVAGRT